MSPVYAWSRQLKGLVRGVEQGRVELWSHLVGLGLSLLRWWYVTSLWLLLLLCVDVFLTSLGH